MADKPIDIGIVFFPGMTQLDVTGPFEVLARLPGARMHLLWKRVEPITSDVGLTLVPTATFDTCPALDVLCIGGGPGRNAVMDDAGMLESHRPDRCDGALCYVGLLRLAHSGGSRSPVRESWSRDIQWQVER